MIASALLVKTESIRKSDETRECVFAVVCRYGMFQHDSIVMMKKFYKCCWKCFPLPVMHNWYLWCEEILVCWKIQGIVCVCVCVCVVAAASIKFWIFLHG